MSLFWSLLSQLCLYVKLDAACLIGNLFSSKSLINQYQTRVYMNAREIGLKQADAAYIAEISERSGQRIKSGSHRPNRGRVRDWRTCADPLAGVWEEELEPMLKREPRLKPMTLYEYLQEKYPGKYPQVLRTVQ